MKVSFDFDGTLSEVAVQDYALKLIEQGVDVWVVTTRYDENHKHRYPMNATLDDLWEVIDRLGIPRWKVRFTCMDWKCSYLDKTSFIWHLDDNVEESYKAKTNGCNVPIVLVTSNSWKTKCKRLLQNWIDKHQRETITS